MSVKLEIPNSHSGAIHALTYNSNGSYLLSGGQDRKINLWNSKTGNKIKTYQFHGYEVLDINVSYDDSKFASCGGDRNAYVCNVTTGTIENKFSGHIARINSVCFNSDCSVVATGSFDKTVKLWDCRSNNYSPIQTLSDAVDSVSSVFIRDANIVTGSVDGKVRIYDIRKGKLSTITINHPVTSVKFSTDGDTVLVSSLDNKIRLMDIDNGTLLQTFQGHRNSLYRIKSNFIKNDAEVISASEDGKVYIWDFISGRMVRTLVQTFHNSTASSTSFALAVHPDSTEIATSSLDGYIQVWRHI